MCQVRLPCRIAAVLCIAQASEDVRLLHPRHQRVARVKARQQRARTFAQPALVRRHGLQRLLDRGQLGKPRCARGEQIIEGLRLLPEYGRPPDLRQTAKNRLRMERVHCHNYSILLGYVGEGTAMTVPAEELAKPIDDAPIRAHIRAHCCSAGSTRR